MARWQTPKIAFKIGGALTDTPYLIERVRFHDQGGDVDSQHIVLEIKDSANVIRICGFDVNSVILTPEDCECEFAELKAGEDSIGGLNSNEVNVAIVYVKIREMLENLGFEVVPLMDPYF